MNAYIAGYLQKTALRNPFSAVPSAADMARANASGAKAYAPTQARLQAAKPNIVVTSGNKRLEMRSQPAPQRAPAQVPARPPQTPQVAQTPAPAPAQPTWSQELARIGGETRRFVTQAAAGNVTAPIQQ